MRCLGPSRGRARLRRARLRRARLRRARLRRARLRQGRLRQGRLRGQRPRICCWWVSARRSSPASGWYGP
ncbi:pentapeptide repeat-containing protein [Streptomyces sp. enrichment culture]|uniref:pentapeptide repeat-containing protein n=1 Tax=Streptomyces sp. enrichment culture TaxID=1795815 RepID=UPI003F57760A